jgi:hypothetical protein
MSVPVSKELLKQNSLFLFTLLYLTTVCQLSRLYGARCEHDCEICGRRLSWHIKVLSGGTEQNHEHSQILLNLRLSSTWMWKLSINIRFFSGVQKKWALTEHLIVVQLVTEITCIFYGTRKFITVSTTASHCALFLVTWILSKFQARFLSDPF